MKVLARASTRQGLFLLAGNDPRGSWQVDGPQLEDRGVLRIDVMLSGG